jgi:quercetin dioxygenase-like cupin family protein
VPHIGIAFEAFEARNGRSPFRRTTEEDAMNEFSRRSALALGVTALAVPLAAWPTAAAAQKYSATDGEELFPGVRLVTLGSRDSTIPAYKTLFMQDVVFQPNGTFPLGDPMMDDMVCTVTEGELAVTAGDEDFVAKEGDVWSCAKGSTRESATNNGTVPAVMRVINLRTA